MAVKAKEKLTLRQWRRLRDYSQEKLAAKVGITSRTVANYESNIETLRRASYENLDAIAKVLDISVDDIFFGTTSDKPK